ncbi:MAG: hypothetical protein ACRD2L_12975 [Terriglobia bacterium]
MRLRFSISALSAFLLAIGSALAGAQDKPAETALPVQEMVKAISENPALAGKSFYYDPGFKAVGGFAIHNHLGKRVCLGYLVSDGATLSYRFIRAWPGLGSSNDAFQIELKKVSKVEYKFYRASKGMLDYFPERLSVKFYFEPPVKGLVAGWSKEDMKFDIWDVTFGYTLMESLKEFGIKMLEKDAGDKDED